MPSISVQYVVITPVRDEAAYLRFTIESMVNQSVRPAEWVIVNDGSSDNTGEIIDEAARMYSWIRPLHRSNRGFRQAGGGVVQAFNDGYSTLTTADWDFIVKLDGDLSFDPDYFERCLAYFKSEPKLGVAGGSIYHMIDGRPCLERGPAFHVRGATKIYRRACWEAIGGFLPAPGWDTLDEVKAQMLGWTTRCFAEIRLIHHRYTGAADGTWSTAMKYGKANYISGYHPLFVLAKCVRRIFRKPYVVASAGLFYGYVKSYLDRVPQVDDPQLIAYVRRQQLGRLVGGQTIWK
jgi:biofilm PGA synthesis N-glycosyltransferase PgaC